MIEKKIKYTDFLGNVREETFRFNLMESEVVELQSSVDGGLAEYGKRIVEAQSLPEIMTLFKKLLLLSYGEISPDGRRFIKEDPVRGKLADEFAQTEAFSNLYMSFIENPESGADFFNQIIPAKMREQMAASEEENPGHAYPPSIAKT